MKHLFLLLNLLAISLFSCSDDSPSSSDITGNYDVIQMSNINCDNPEDELIWNLKEDQCESYDGQFECTGTTATYFFGNDGSFEAFLKSKSNNFRNKKPLKEHSKHPTTK